MKITPIALFIVTVAVSGCATSATGGRSWFERCALMEFAAPGFKMPQGHDTDVYGILAAVKEQMPAGSKVISITFDPQEGVTVFFAAPPGSLMHGGSFATATREGDKWKIGELWTLARNGTESRHGLHGRT